MTFHSHVSLPQGDHLVFQTQCFVLLPHGDINRSCHCFFGCWMLDPPSQNHKKSRALVAVTIFSSTNESARTMVCTPTMDGQFHGETDDELMINGYFLQWIIISELSSAFLYRSRRTKPDNGEMQHLRQCLCASSFAKQPCDMCSMEKHIQEKRGIYMSHVEYIYIYMLWNSKKLIFGLFLLDVPLPFDP